MRNSPLQRHMASILLKRRWEKKPPVANSRDKRVFPGEGQFKTRNKTGKKKIPNHLGEGI